jgi:hypothetical protein
VIRDTAVELVELEIARHDWAALPCGCGRSAAHVAADLSRMARATAPEDADIELLSGHVFIPSVLYEPAVPAVSVALAALADDVAPPAREGFLELLLMLSSGEGQDTDAAARGRDLPAECIAAIRPGVWLLYSEVFSASSVGAAGHAYETLTLVETDADRLARVQTAAGDRLPWDLR